METLKAGKLGITEQSVLPLPEEPAPFLADLDFRSAPPLLGYVQTRPKPASQVLLASIDGDPLLARWQCGRGVGVAFTSDVHGRWAAAWRRWPDFGRFWGRLARHAMRKDNGQQLRKQPANGDSPESIAELNAGRHAHEGAAVSTPRERIVRRTRSFWSYLLTVAALLFVFDVALKRIDFPYVCKCGLRPPKKRLC